MNGMHDLMNKLPPYSPEAEAALLGSIILDSSVLDDVADHIRGVEDFWTPAHQMTYTAMLDLHRKGHRVDMVKLHEVLRDRGQLEQVGGVEYLIELAESSPSAAAAHDYARMVAEKAVLRRLVEVGGDIMHAGLNGKGDAGEQLDRAQSAIFDLAMKSDSRTGVHRLGTLLDEVIADVERRAETGNRTGLATGFYELDDITGGMQGGEVTVLAARPSMGKSALAMNIAEHVADHGHGVAFFSLEMGPQSLASRVLSGQAAVPAQVLRYPKTLATAEHWQKIASATGRMADWPLFVVDVPGASVDQVRASSRKLVARDGVKLIVLDYLQLLARQRGMSTNDAVGANSRAIKAMARELNVPVLMLAQLNRDVERRDIKMPGLADLRDSGEIEQDADVVLFIHRPDYYARQENVHHEPDHKAYIGVAKQRNGATGRILLHWDGERTRFGNWTNQEIA